MSRTRTCSHMHDQCPTNINVVGYKDVSLPTSFPGPQLHSKTFNNGPSEMRTTSLQQTPHLPLIDFAIELIHYEPLRSGYLLTQNNGH